jgi:hypothetical protein
MVSAVRGKMVVAEEDLCGKKTDTAAGVGAEVSIAQEEKVSYFLLQGYKDGGCKAPTSAKGP